MIVTHWTMKRFQNTVFFTLLCWRITHGLPTPVPSVPAADPPTEQQQQESEQPATAPATAATTARSKPNGEEGTYFQGDIRLLPTDDPYDLYNTVFKRAAFDQSGSGIDLDALDPRKWPNRRIPYVFPMHLDMDYRDMFERAIHEWERVTCVDFVRISDFNITEEAYLVLTDTAGCSSYVGKIGGPQEVSIEGCKTLGHTMHELGHALGLWHEHSRWDRDMYITIVRENIIDSAYYNFGVLAEEKWSHIPDVGYDLLSIMHYGPTSFSKNGNVTIRVVSHIDIPDCATDQMGQRRRLSKRDKLRISMMYDCENETRRAQNLQDKCDFDLSSLATATTPTAPPTTPPPPPPPTDKLMNNDRLRLNIDSSQHESLFCTEHRCTKNQCEINRFSQRLVCEEGFDFTIHHYIPRKNQKIKHNDTVNIQSLHRKSRWLECSGQNICSISDCPSSNGNQNVSNISECDNQRFKVISNTKVLKNGIAFKLKHESNNTYVYCTSKWCDLLRPCTAGESESDSLDRDEVLCHSATEFYVEKLFQ